MTLPATGEISFDAIRIELGIPSQTSFSIDTAENGGYVTINKCASPYPFSDNPASISEWRGYNHSAALATLLSANGQDYSATSCPDACNLTINCGTELYTKSSKVYTNASCSASPSAGYYALCDRSDCYDVASNGTYTSVGCVTTTTTTTTTTAACVSFTYAVVTSLTDCSVGSYPNTGYQNTGFGNGSTLNQFSNCTSGITDTYIQRNSDATNYQLDGTGIIVSSNNPLC